MKVWMRGDFAWLDGLPAAVDVLEVRAGEAADGAGLGPLGNLGDGGEVAFGGDGEAGLDDVDAHLVEEAGDLQLFLVGHGRAGGLLAVAEGGVEDDDFILGHGGVLFLAVAWGALVTSERSRPGARSEAAKKEETTGQAGGERSPRGSGYDGP